MAKSDPCSDTEFIRLFESKGAAEAAKILGVNTRSIYARRAALEKRLGVLLYPPSGHNGERRLESHILHPKRLLKTILNGRIVIGSDAHYWPEVISTAHRGLVHVTKELEPALIVLDGDLFDGAKASRHAPIGWARTPNINDELEAVHLRTEELRAASPKSECAWLLGNHDLRFDSKLASQSPEYQGVRGTSLSDHFPHWQMAMSLWINDAVVIKHRWKGGVHATHNNTINAGKTMVTGHLHSLKVTPFDDYNGTRFGIDTGTLADPDGPQFEYGEDNPQNHRSGFIVLTFKDGELLWPEVCRVVREGVVEFRGEYIEV